MKDLSGVRAMSIIRQTDMVTKTTATVRKKLHLENFATFICLWVWSFASVRRYFLTLG